MSVPFKYRQYFRDLYASFGGKPMASSDITFIAERLPPPKFSPEIVETYVGQCPLDEAGLLRFFGEGQKASGIGYDELAWGLVEGMARANYFNNEEGGDASCDTKELRTILDPKIRPVRLDINAIFSSQTSSGERTTIAELMLVFKAIFPANQTSFEQLFSWARASRPAGRRPKLPAVGGGEGSPLGKADDHPAPTTNEASPPLQQEAGASTTVGVASTAAMAPTGVVDSADVVVAPVVSTRVAQEDVAQPAPAGATPGTGGGGFSQLRERFGSVAKVKPPPNTAAAVVVPQTAPPQLGATPPQGLGALAATVAGTDGGVGNSPPASPAPPPPPEGDDDDDDDAASPNKQQEHREDVAASSVDPGAASDFAAYVASKSASTDAPVVVVSPPPPPPLVKRPGPQQAEAQSTPPNPASTGSKRHPSGRDTQQDDPSQQQQHHHQQRAAANNSPPASTLKEPPPLPQHVRAAMAQMGQQQQQQQGSGGAEAVGANAAGYRETLSLRQVQRLPPEVVDFIQQLDRQRSQLQSQLQRELDDLTDNTQMMRMIGDKIESLKALQATPVFKGLENERVELIHKMEQWVHATRAGKEATRSEVARLRNTLASDAAAHAVYRDTLLYATGGPATTSTYTPAGTAAATAALAALNDPTPRLARFFESLSSKEREIKAQESALEKLRLLEKREKRLLAEIAKEEAAHAPQLNTTRGGGAAHPADNTGTAMRDDRTRGFHTSGPTVAAVPVHYQQTSRVFRMDPSILQSSSPASTHTKPQQQQVPSHMYFSNSAQAAAVPAGVSRDNPYLSRNVADRHRSSLDAGATVTRRLEDYLTSKPNAAR